MVPGGAPLRRFALAVSSERAVAPRLEQIMWRIHTEEHWRIRMPRYSAVTFSVQPVEQNGDISGYVVGGFLTRAQLDTLWEFVDSDDYGKSKKWRGEYQEMANAIVGAVDSATGASSSDPSA